MDKDLELAIQAILHIESCSKVSHSLSQGPFMIHVPHAFQVAKFGFWCIPDLGYAATRMSSPSSSMPAFPMLEILVHNRALIVIS